MKVPPLCLIDRLLELEYVPHRRQVVLSSDNKNTFDIRRGYQKSYYFRCVLIWESLNQAGVETLRSGEPEVYYKVLFKTGKPTERGLKALAYKEMLQDGTADGVVHAALGDFGAIGRPPIVVTR